MTNSIKPRIDAQGMVLIRAKADKMRQELEDFAMDLAMDYAPEPRDHDTADDPDPAIDVLHSLMGFIADSILQDIRREF